MRVNPAAPPFDVTRVSTPLSSCITLAVGKVDERVVAQLESAGFDQAPLLDETESTIGVVLTKVARSRMDDGQALTARDAITARLRPPTDIVVLLKALGTHRAALIEEDGRPSALVTISDLNRHVVLLALYEPLARFEISLADFVQRNSKTDEWLPALAEHHQAEILGYWELSRRKNVDIGPMARCTLTHLITAVTKIRKLYTMLGFASRRQAEETLGGLPALRNNVMHPVRPLVLRPEDALEIAERLSRLREVAERIGEPHWSRPAP